jgi:hypothetical protein
MLTDLRWDRDVPCSDTQCESVLVGARGKKPLAGYAPVVISIPRFTKIAFGRAEFLKTGILLRFPRAKT